MAIRSAKNETCIMISLFYYNLRFLLYLDTSSNPLTYPLYLRHLNCSNGFICFWRSDFVVKHIVSGGVTVFVILILFSSKLIFGHFKAQISPGRIPLKAAHGNTPYQIKPFVAVVSKNSSTELLL